MSRRHAFRLSPRHRQAFALSLGGSLGTGIAWWLLQHFGQSPGDFGPTPHPAQAWLLRAHGASAFASLIVLGTLLPTHVKRAWRAHRNRLTGIVLLSLVGVQILTGYALYYADQDLRERAAQLHWLLGLGLPALLLLHIVIGRRRAHDALPLTPPAPKR
jgi:heme A synthase